MQSLWHKNHKNKTQRSRKRIRGVNMYDNRIDEDEGEENDEDEENWDDEDEEDD